MNLLAFFETLEIGRESLAELDENALIRIEKQVHLQRKLHPDIDMNLANAMISALRNDGKAFRFVLENRRLFNFFTGKVYSMNMFKPQTAEVHEVQAFIEKYLRDDLLLSLDKMLIANQFEDLDDILEEKDYFPEDIQFTISRKLLSKVDFGIARLREGQYSAIQYLKFRTFYYSLSHFSSVDTDSKMRLLLDVVADHYNARRNIDFVGGVMTAMSVYKTEDEDLKRVLVSNGDIVSSPSKPGSKGSWGWSTWRIVLFGIGIFVKLIVFGSHCSRGSSSAYNERTDYYQYGTNNTYVDSIARTYAPYEVTNMNTDENFRDYLTAFDSSLIENFKKADTLKTGMRPFEIGAYLKTEVVVEEAGVADKKPELKTSDEGIAKFYNDTPYDAVLMQYDHSYLGESYFVKKGETLSLPSTEGTTFTYRIYIGNELAKFTAHNDERFRSYEGTQPREMRFRHLTANTAVALEKEFSLKEGKTTLGLEHDRFKLVGDNVACDACVPARTNSGERVNKLN